MQRYGRERAKKVPEQLAVLYARKTLFAWIQEIVREIWLYAMLLPVRNPLQLLRARSEGCILARATILHRAEQLGAHGEVMVDGFDGPEDIATQGHVGF